MDTTPRKKPHKKPPLPLKKPKITFWKPNLTEGSNEEAIAMNVMQELTSRDLGDEGVEAEKEILKVLIFYLGKYNEITEDQQDTEFKKKLEKDITIFQNYVNNQTGGKRRKKKTRKKRGGKRRKKKTRKKRGGEGLKDLSAEELKAALDRSLSYHIHLFAQLVEADREFNYKFRHPDFKGPHKEPSVEEQLFGKYEDWRYDKMMEHKGIWTDYGDEMGQYIANAPIDELNGTMDFYCENWKSALGERLKNSILNFKEINKKKIQEINFEHFFEYDKIAKEYKKLEKLYLEFIDRIKEIYEVYKEKKKMKDIEERQEKKERDDDEYGTFEPGAGQKDPEYDDALDKYRKYYKGEDIKPMMKAYFDNKGFGWNGKAPNEILGHNDYKKPLIDITKHQEDNIDEEFDYHYFDGEWVENNTKGPTSGGRRLRKKRGGMEEQPTPPQPPRDNDVGTNQYEPGQLGVQQQPPLPQFMLPPPANPERVIRNRSAAIRMEGAPANMRRSLDETERRVYRANERYRRSQRSHLRNLTGDLLERCTGSRCGLGGRRSKKRRKRKNRKNRTKKRSRRRR